MRREDIFMDLIGELDDNYIALAMSRPKRRAIVSETRKVTFVQPVEVEKNVSKRELRLYYITRVLGMAAVTFLIVGAAVLLIMNWDKIIVRDPDTPPVVTTDVTTVTDTTVISESATSQDIPSIIDQIEAGYTDATEWGITMEAVSADNNGVVIEISQSGGSITGQIKYGYGFTVEKYTNGEWVNEISQYGDYWEYELAPGGTNREYWAYGKKLDAGKYRFVKNFVALRAPGDFDIASGYAEFEISETNSIDLFEQITDTSMPDLITGHTDDDSYYNFEFPWKLELRGIPIELMRLVDESNTEKWFESIKPLNSGTPYRIDRGYSLYSYITGVGLSWDKAKPILERDFSADEISAMVSGNMELITKNSASEYTIVIGDCAYSPKWLYYHTTEDYKAVGITPGMVGDMLMQYQKLGLPDEMWKAFREKLVLYCTKDLYDESAVKATYLIETDNAEPFGDRAFEILENNFYGEWELADTGEHDLFTDISFTYSKDIFKHEGTPVSGIFETDEIYVIAYSNFGVGNSYIIKKSEPDVMYEAEIAGYNVGVDVAILSVSDMQNKKYVNRKAALPELKSGELSVLGEKKLFHTYGKTFEDSFNAALGKDKSEGIETGMGTAYSTYKDIYSFGYPPRYIADFTDDTVNMLLPYYYMKDGAATVIYAVKSFSCNYKGEWEAVNIWTDEGIAPLYGMNDASGTTIPVGMLGEFDLDALTAKVFSDNGTFTSSLNKFLDGLSDKELAAQYRRAFALGTAGCRDMEDYENTEVLRQFYGDDYERSGKRAVVYSNSGAGTDNTSGNGWVNAVKDHLDSILSDGSGNILGKSSGYSFTSVMNAYLRTFSASYINEVFPQLPFCKCSDELFYRDASMVIPDCYYEFNLSGGEDRAVIAVMGYAKDKATGTKTDEIIYGIEAIFDKTSEGWKCSRFNPHSINQ